MTNLKFQQIIPKPDANSSAAAAATASSNTPLARSSHGLSIIQNGSILVLYGGENIARTPIDNPSQALWLAKKNTTKKKSSNNANGTEEGSESWQWISPTISGGTSAGAAAAVPPSRVAHAQAAVGNNVYIFGGRNGIHMGENPMNDMWMLQIIIDNDDTTATAIWTRITPPQGDDAVLPSARSFHKMIAVGTTIYMFGGCGARGRLNDLWKFDTISNKWTNLGSSHVLKGRGGPNILSLSDDNDNNKKIAIVAGFAGEETNDGHVYNDSSSSNNIKAWEVDGMTGLADMRPRSVCCFASLSQEVNKCVIFGGEVDPSQKGHEGAGGFERDVVILDGTSGAMLENIKPSCDDDEVWPGNRGWADATAHGDTFYIFGGLAGDDATPVRLDDLWQCKVSP